MKRKTMWAIVAAVLAVSPSARAIMLGQKDTFTDGGLSDWEGGSMRSNSTNGMDGPTDRYLRVEADGGPLGARNSLQWTGDYLAAGVTAIGMDLANFGATTIEFRLMLRNLPWGTYTMTDAIVLSPGSGWSHHVMELTEENLTSVGAETATLPVVLSNVTRMNFRHDPGPPSGTGTRAPITGILGIDNIEALPEPATAALLAVGLAGLLARRRRR